MTVFWIVAALFVLGALLLMLPPLLRGTPGGDIGSRGANLAVHRDPNRDLPANSVCIRHRPHKHPTLQTTLRLPNPV